MINNFQSLYLRKNINRSKSEWANIGSQLKFFLKLLTSEEKAKELYDAAVKTNDILQFNQFEGQEKGRIIRDFKASFLKRFSEYPDKTKILKGKNPRRIFWEVITPSNAEAIFDWVNDYIK